MPRIYKSYSAKNNENMSEFKSWRSFLHFSNSVIREERYIRTEHTEKFLDTVLSTSLKRQRKLKSETILWRCQNGHAWRMHEQGDEKFEIPDVFSSARMKPTAEYASDGRANPQGIPSLYLATELDTAISETRPWIGSIVTVAQFKTTRSLKIVDCASEEPAYPLFMGEPNSQDREMAVWAYIDKSFSEPVTRNEDTRRYIPTQILAELFKANGIDGIAYRSNFGENGINIVLFDLDAANVLNRQLYRVKNIQITSHEDDSLVGS